MWVSEIVWKPAKSSNVLKTIQHIITNDQNGIPLRTETVTTLKTNDTYIDNPIDHFFWMVEYYTSLNPAIDTPTENIRPPWTWILPVGNWGNPPDYLVTAVKTSCEGCETKTYFPIRYRAQTPIFIWFMTVPIIGLALYHYKEKESKFILSYIAGTFGPWFVWEVLKPVVNMPFNHYFLFTAPIISLGIPWFWNKTMPKYWKQITAVHLICTIIFFFWFFPVGLRRTI